MHYWGVPAATDPFRCDTGLLSTRQLELTARGWVLILRGVTSREVIKKLLKLGCTALRQKGSHKFFVSPDGQCFTTVADHPGDIKKGTLHGIERDMEPCLGKNWLTR